MTVRRILFPVLLSAALNGAASATTYDFGVSYAAPALTARVGVNDLNLGGNRLAFSVSNRAATFGLRRNQPLTALGTLQLGLNVAGVYAGQTGLRLDADASGSLGPVALNLAGSLWNAPAAAQDPLSVWNQVAVPTSVSGAQLDASARYRLSRDVIVSLGGELGLQSSAVLSGEYRLSPSWSARLGARGGVGVLGAVAGVTYRADALTLSADALLGRESGVTLSLDAPALIALSAERAVDLSAYLAYEPWRTAALPLRYGLDAQVPIGPADTGALNVGLRGGNGGLGLRVGYTFTPGGGE